MVIPERCDLLVVGGGIHGAGIARDAAGRGLDVVLVEQHDLAAATSMASSKLIHGGLRYLEQGRLRLVREALSEREILLRVGPHLVRPLSFVMPLGPGSRPAWQLQVGLWLYDHVAGRSSLSRSRAMVFKTDGVSSGLRQEVRRGFAYSDACGDDARLVVANARGAADLGASILTRTRCTQLDGSPQGWVAHLEREGRHLAAVETRAVVNATGPWVDRFLGESAGIRAPSRVRLVKGSHLVVRRNLPQGHAYILQNDDGRVVFVVPFEQDFALIGTTDVPAEKPGLVGISAAEIEYLCGAFARYFTEPIRDEEIVWSFAGIRALHDDGSGDPSRVSRDYMLEVCQGVNGAPILTVYGGKLTTYRKMAERALNRLAQDLPGMGPEWTSAAPLPGGDIPNGTLEPYVEALVSAHARLPPEWIRALARRHGSLATRILGGAESPEELGRHFGGGLTAREIDYLIEREWAVNAEDVLYRRTKAALHMTAAERGQVELYLRAKVQTG